MRPLSPAVAVLAMVALVGCTPGVNMVDMDALQARVAQQSARPKTVQVTTPPSALASLSKPVESPYRLGVADVVRISVLNNPNLNSVQPVRPDGKIDYFPAGNLTAAGLTVDELRDIIVRRLRSSRSGPYRVGIQDVLEITVYGHKELNTTQSVGPDGTISVLPGGTLRAAGMTVNEISAQVSRRIAGIVKDPIVNVAVGEYRSQPLFIENPVVNVVVDEINSRRVAVLGAVVHPGIVNLRAPTTLLEALSYVGGLSADADLQRSLVIRNGKVLPASLERLLKHGDVMNNIYLQPNDSVLVASSRFNKVYVIGEVGNPGPVTWEGSLNLMEAISEAGGFKTDAKPGHVLVVRGGLVNPTLEMVDAAGIIYRGELDRNVGLGRGDIVYVPSTELATAERYLGFVAKLMQPILGVESAILLGKSVSDVLVGSSGPGTSINVGP